MDERILMIEDEEDLSGTVCLVLEQAGYKAKACRNGRSGLQAARDFHPDLILLDILLPDIDGWVVCEQLQRITDAPIIFTTALGSERDVIRGLELGADDYMIKPFSCKELLARVRSALSRAQPGASSLQENAERPRRLETLSQQIPPDESGPIPFGELGHLVSGIVHDLRGGLGVIVNTAGFLLDSAGADDAFSNDLHKIVKSAEFCEVVIRNLAALGGEEAYELTEVNIEKVVREVVFMLERKLVDVTLVVDADPVTSTIVADEGQMKQVFMNLIKNAGEAMPDGGTLTLRTRREGQRLRIEVSDTGHGISPENQERLFRDFFTTKEQGYGLGLYIVQSIVKRHGGTIKVESKVGEGTIFTLYLPIELGGEDVSSANLDC